MDGYEMLYWGENGGDLGDWSKRVVIVRWEDFRGC